MTQLLLVTIFHPSPNPWVRWYLFYQKSIIIIITIIIILCHLQCHNWSENRDGSFSCSKSSRWPQRTSTAWTYHWMKETIRQKDKNKDTIKDKEDSNDNVNNLSLVSPDSNYLNLSLAETFCQKLIGLFLNKFLCFALLKAEFWMYWIINSCRRKLPIKLVLQRYI